MDGSRCVIATVRLLLGARVWEVRGLFLWHRAAVAAAAAASVGAWRRTVWWQSVPTSSSSRPAWCTAAMAASSCRAAECSLTLEVREC